MAANNETTSPSRNRTWYREELTEINGPIRKLLESYSKISSDEIVKHVNRIRERGFESNPYPCIGLYRFLNLTLITHPLYSTLLQRLKSPGATYLDLGCCFGQDLRQLVEDDVPSQHLTGLDIEGRLMDLGYELFLDRKSLRSRFVVADIFKGAAQGSVWTDLEEQSFDVVHCSAFIPLFTLEEQIAAATNIAKLVKRGGLIVGRQVGSVKPGNVAAVKEGSKSYRHDVETFDAMWRQVGEVTDTKWQVEGTLDMLGIDTGSPVEDVNSRRLLFTVTRLD